MTFLHKSLLLSCALLAGCASTPNSGWFENGMMSYEVLEVGQREYKLVAIGAGAHKLEQVERAFAVRADQLCDGKRLPSKLQAEQYQYSSSGGGFFFRHSAFKTTGIVKCA